MAHQQLSNEIYLQHHKGIIMNTTKIARPAFYILLALVIVGALAWALANGHSTGWYDGSLIMFDDDYSDSVLGWMIAIPILILTAVFVAIVLAGTGVLVAGVLVMALVMTLLALVFAFAMTVLPILAFLAVPVLAVVGLVKLLSRRHVPPANFSA